MIATGNGRSRFIVLFIEHFYQVDYRLLSLNDIRDDYYKSTKRVQMLTYAHLRPDFHDFHSYECMGAAMV